MSASDTNWTNIQLNTGEFVVFICCSYHGNIGKKRNKSSLKHNLQINTVPFLEIVKT